MKRGQTAWQVAVMIAIGSVAGAPAIAQLIDEYRAMKEPGALALR